MGLAAVVMVRAYAKSLVMATDLAKAKARDTAMMTHPVLGGEFSSVVTAMKMAPVRDD